MYILLAFIDKYFLIMNGKIALLSSVFLSIIMHDGHAQTDTIFIIGKRESYNRNITNKESWDWGIKAGGGYGYELGVIRSNIWTSIPLGATIISLTNEFPYRTTWVNPKLSIEASFILFTGRLSIIDYTNFQKHDVRFRPELGFSLGGIITATYYRDAFFTSERFLIKKSGWWFSTNIGIPPKGKKYW